MQIAIFSDLHLRFQEKDQVALFQDLLQKLLENPEANSKGNELWLLGDIFDVFIGPFPEWRDRCPGVFQVLENLILAGWKILWIQGNHDFYVEELLRPMGIEVSDSVVVRIINGKKIYLAHGDLVNQDDHKYLKWRAWTRSSSFKRALKWFYKSGGVRAIEALALQMSRRSRKRGPSIDKTGEIQSIFRSFARLKKREGYDMVILGHSHIEESLNSDDSCFLNLGSWVNYSPRYALWDPEKESFPKIQLS